MVHVLRVIPVELYNKLLQNGTLENELFNISSQVNISTRSSSANISESEREVESESERKVESESVSEPEQVGEPIYSSENSAGDPSFLESESDRQKLESVTDTEDQEPEQKVPEPSSAPNKEHSPITLPGWINFADKFTLIS